MAAIRSKYKDGGHNDFFNEMCNEFCSVTDIFRKRQKRNK